MFRSRFVEISNGFLLVLVLAWMSAGARSSVADQAGPVDIERLGQRVNAYFTAVRSGQFDQARQFILPLSRSSSTLATAREGPGLPISALSRSQLEEGNRSAVAEVRLEVMAPIMWRARFRSSKEIPLEEGVR